MEQIRRERRLGYTLLELAIVITVIALLIGGVLVGRALIRNAELQAIVADVSRFKQAAKLFRDKYQYLPGDLPNAASFWGTDSGCNAAALPNTDGTVPNTVRKRETCGGNGNGIISGYNGGAEWPTAALIGSSSANREAIRAWQHLANAALIEGSYCGAASNNPSGYFPGMNVPRSTRSDQNGFVIFHASPIGDGLTLPNGLFVLDVWPGRYGHVIGYGKARGEDIRNGLKQAGLSATDAAYIDQKTDDGKPAHGAVVTFRPPLLAQCVTSFDASTAQYRVTTDRVTCALVFMTGL